MRRNEFIEITNLKGEHLLINPDHIIMIDPCDNGSQITFDSTITYPGEFEQKNYMFIQESYAWMKFALTRNFSDGHKPERYSSGK